MLESDIVCFLKKCIVYYVLYNWERISVGIMRRKCKCSFLFTTHSLWIYIPCMQKRKSKKYNKCVNCIKLSFSDGRTSALGGGGGLDCCDMQNAASLQNFCSVLASGKFPAPWLTQKVQLFKAFQSCVSLLQGDADKHWIEELGELQESFE